MCIGERGGWERAGSVASIYLFVNCFLKQNFVFVRRLQIFGKSGGEGSSKTYIEAVSESVDDILDQFSIRVRGKQELKTVNIYLTWLLVRDGAKWGFRGRSRE